MILANKLEIALSASTKGWSIFPLTSGHKEPLKGFSWRESSSSNRQQIESWHAKYPNCNWGLDCGKSGLFVLDIDAGEGKVGDKSFEHLTLQKGNLPDTLIVQTPKGGYHHIFTGEGKNSASILGKDLDTRGDGGYIVLAGSKTVEVRDEKGNLKQAAGEYRIVNQKPVVAAPVWILETTRTEKFELPKDEGEVVDEGQRNHTLAHLGGNMRRVGMDYPAILAALTSINDTKFSNPLPDSEVERTARSVASYAPDVMDQALAFGALKVNAQGETGVISRTCDMIDPKAVLPRSWIMEGRLIRKFVSVVVAPGGVGKSTLSMIDAAAIASGRDLLGHKIAEPGRAWIYNAEDPIDELERRMVAIAQHFKLTKEELSRIHITSGREYKIVVAAEDRGTILINDAGIENVKRFIKENKIDVSFFDPLVRLHQVTENGNEQMDAVADVFGQIADHTNSAVQLVHHTRKVGDLSNLAGNAEAARGGGALVNAVRQAHTLSPMSKDEAAKMCVPSERRLWYVRLDVAKGNLFPPAERAEWFQKVSVKIPNGDYVGIIEPADLDEGVGAEDAQTNQIKASLILLASDNVLLTDLARRFIDEQPQFYGGEERMKLRRQILACVGEGITLDNGLGYTLVQSKTGVKAFTLKIRRR